MFDFNRAQYMYIQWFKT